MASTATALTTEELLTQLSEGTARLASTDEWTKWLSVQRRFHNYSFGNCLLIAHQNPDATRVAGFHTWKGLKRLVRKGERGIRILAPMTGKRELLDAQGEKTTQRFVCGFKAVSVFDISQTDGAELPTAPVQRLSGDAPESAFAELTNLATARNYTVELLDVLHGERNGDCNFLTRKIRVRATLAPAMRVKTLAHELAHAILHEDGALERAQCELEAESVAYVVCAGLDIDSSQYSFGYLANWAGGGEEAQAGIRASGDRISGAAREILAGLDREQREAA